MEADAYTLMASHEAEHWWFVGRRAVIEGLLDRMALPRDARILEAGCGTGGNLYMLQARGQVFAFEPHEAAVAIARDRYPGLVIQEGELPRPLPFPDESFDLVAALDVLEHIDDDREGLQALVRQVRPGGYLLLSVPTHPILWGSHDRRLHHRRRYDVGELRRSLEIPGTSLEYFGAYNTLLAPIAFALRLAEKVVPLDFGNQERLPPRPLNAALAAVFGIEGRLVRTWQLPFGLSHAAILRRT